MQVELVFEPRVLLVASTAWELDWPIAREWPFHDWANTLDATVWGSAESIVEFAGRNCYQSWHRPNPETARTPDYVRNLLDRRHFSVLEHVSFTVYIDGISRACSHQIVRHRHFSFSQLSHRFVRPTVLRIVIPPYYRHDEQAIQVLRSAAAQAAQAYEQLVAAAPRKKAVTEAARDVLPHMIETALVMTGNLRAWYEFFEKRLAPSADAEIRDVAARCLAVAKTVAPTVFAGFEAAGGNHDA